MGKFIQKFNSLEAYNEAEHDYPNVSLVEGSGLLYQAEEPQPDPCFITETQEQFNANLEVVQNALDDFGRGTDFDADFYFLKDDVADLLENISGDDALRRLFGMIKDYTSSFMANCENATVGLREDGDDSSYVVYKIGVEPESNAKAPVPPLEDYIEIRIASGQGTTVDTSNMTSDRYDFNIGYHPR